MPPSDSLLGGRLERVAGLESSHPRSRPPPATMALLLHPLPLALPLLSLPTPRCCSTPLVISAPHTVL